MPLPGQRDCWKIWPSGRPGACGGDTHFGARCDSARRGGARLSQLQSHRGRGSDSRPTDLYGGSGAATRRLYGERTEFAGGRAVRERRTHGARLDAADPTAPRSAVVTEFDLYGLLIHGDKSKDVKLQSGDVIFIPPAGPQAAVTGSVRNPAIYELREHESLAGLLADAGGITSVAAEARVSIERIENHRDRSAMEVAYDASGLATLPADGDLVNVFSIVPLYRKTVILRGNAANPGRFAWHPGMRVSELIPDRESLITRNYWWKRAQLGQSVPEFDPIQGYDNLRQPAENRAIPIKALPLEDASTANPAQNQNQSVNPAQNQYQNYPNANQAQSQNPSAEQRSGNTTLASAQSSSVSRVPLPAQRTEIKALAPEIDWNYAAIERLDPETLKNTVIPFDLGKLVLQHDGSQDLELQAGDVVTIFSESDIRVPIAQQTKLVTLGGEFVHAGVYTVQPGETFRHLAERAGGLTPDAYLYGSELTRESTRAVQQARIDEYVQSLSMGIQRSSLAMSASDKYVTEAEEILEKKKKMPIANCETALSILVEG